VADRVYQRQSADAFSTWISAASTGPRKPQLMGRVKSVIHRAKGISSEAAQHHVEEDALLVHQAGGDLHHVGLQSPGEQHDERQRNPDAQSSRRVGRRLPGEHRHRGEGQDDAGIHARRRTRSLSSV
jgi:hypothetical protein